MDACRFILSGPDPRMLAVTHEEDLSALTRTMAAWRDELAVEQPDTVRDLRSLIAVCVPDHDRGNQVMNVLQVEAGITSAEITKSGPRGDDRGSRRDDAPRQGPRIPAHRRPGGGRLHRAPRLVRAVPG